MRNPDLHVHTSYSDGDCTPREVVRLGRRAGLPAIAICDHDECRAFGEVQGETGITVIPGIELDAALGASVHILGLWIDWRNAALLRHVKKAAAARMERAREMLERFREANVPLRMEEVLMECDGAVVGRPHFAAALVKKGLASSTKEAFARYLGKDACCYVPLKKLDAARAAALILDAGGKPVLAHPGLVRGAALETLAPQLKEMGFWGIEAYHPAHTNGQCRQFEGMARRLGLFVTAGSDFHGSAKPDHQIGQEQRGGAYLKQSLEALGTAPA